MFDHTPPPLADKSPLTRLLGQVAELAGIFPEVEKLFFAVPGVVYVLEPSIGEGVPVVRRVVADIVLDRKSVV